MLYEFQLESGEILEKSFPMGKCPQEISLEDGSIAKRIFSIPFVSFKNNNLNAIRDSKKWRAEAIHKAKEIGMQNFMPMKGQSPQQQLKDLNANRSMFSDQMAKANEEVVERQSKKMRAISEANRRKATPEAYMKRQEAKQEMAFKRRSISI